MRFRVSTRVTENFISIKNRLTCTLVAWSKQLPFYNFYKGPEASLKRKRKQWFHGFTKFTNYFKMSIIFRPPFYSVQSSFAWILLYSQRKNLVIIYSSWMIFWTRYRIRLIISFRAKIFRSACTLSPFFFIQLFPFDSLFLCFFSLISSHSLLLVSPPFLFYSRPFSLSPGLFLFNAVPRSRHDDLSSFEERETSRWLFLAEAVSLHFQRPITFSLLPYFLCLQP